MPPPRSNSKPCVTFGQFYGLNYLLRYYDIKSNNAIDKLARLNVKCHDLTVYFSEKELKKIKPLIYLLFSKNKKPLNDIVKEGHSQKESIFLKNGTQISTKLVHPRIKSNL